jgi:hypothetical protein
MIVRRDASNPLAKPGITEGKGPFWMHLNQQVKTTGCTAKNLPAHEKTSAVTISSGPGSSPA